MSGETQEEWWLGLHADVSGRKYHGPLIEDWLSVCGWMLHSRLSGMLPAGSCCKSTALRSALGDVRFYLSDRGMGEGWKKQRIREKEEQEGGRGGGQTLLSVESEDT